MVKELQGKLHNQQRIFNLLKAQGEITKQEIAASLNLSMPTVLHNIDTMMQAGLLVESGTMESTGGRKAKKISLNKDAGYAIGIDLALHHVELILTNLSHEIICKKIIPTKYEDTIEWYEKLESESIDFIKDSQIDATNVIGCGISFPGIVDEQMELLVKSHIFNMEHINLNRFKKAIPFPIVVSNDANCACVAESTGEKKTYLYLSLNESVGGAVMFDGQLYLGDTFQAGEIGHMILDANGRTCYCGKKGCVDAYLSPKVFRTIANNTEEFFELVQAGDQKASSIFEEYLEILAIFISNLRMIMNTDVILGGEVGTYMEDYLDAVCRKTIQYDLFARDIDYIFSCRTKKSACALGASVLAIERYAHHLIEEGQ